MIIFVAFFIHFGIHFASILHTLLCLKLAPHTTVCLSSKIALGIDFGCSLPIEQDLKGRGRR